MKRFLLKSSFLLAIASLTPLLSNAQSPPDPHRALLTTYCATCHSARAKMGGLTLEGIDLQTPAGNAQTFEKVLRKLRGRQMPPPGSPQPSQQQIDSFVSWMETSLDAHPSGPRAGFVPIQRLNRTEYAATVKSLVGVDVNAKEVLPQDIQVDGFDNIADALTVSPAFLDQYVTAARQVAHLAVGSPKPRVSSVKYPISAINNPDLPLPPGTRDGVRFQHNFEADGEYRINIRNLGVGPYSASLENEVTLVITIDGKIVARKSIGGPEDLALADRKAGTGRAQIMERFSKIPVHVQAGQHDVVVAFIDRSHVETGELLEKLQGYAGTTGGAASPERMSDLRDGIEVSGPYESDGISRTPSRALIFTCEPRGHDETSCARQITQNLAHRAFRRPITPADMNRLLPFYEAVRKDGGTFDEGIEQVVAAVLVSPQFLYRTIPAPPSSPAAEFKLTDLELASRLSFFLWNTGPDEELLTLAESNGLTRPGVLDKQVRRMLGDSKASSLVTSFAMKWLNLTNLEQVVPDPVLFPQFSDPIRRDFFLEAQSFVDTVFSEDRSVLELLTGNFTFVNDRLAALYGIPGVRGTQLRKVTLNDPARFGLLGKGAVLLRTSYGDRTSPVLRGNWVLDKLMGTPSTPPPPDTATDLSQKAGEQPKTVRARLEQHRDKPQCKMCHGVIDPTGLALENFDAIGRWRTTDPQAANSPIDASTVLPNGTPINGVAELRAQLLSRPEIFARTFTEKLMMYAVNRRLEYFDMPQVRNIVRAAAKENYKFSSIVLGIVQSDAFRKQAPDANSNAVAMDTRRKPRTIPSRARKQAVATLTPQPTNPRT